MLRLDAYVQPSRADDVSAALVSLPGVRHVTAGAPTSEGQVRLSAEVDGPGADAAIESLAALGVASDDVTLWRVPGVRPLEWHRRTRSADSDAQVWAEVVGKASEHAEVASTYLIYMTTAGVIAGIGVLTGSAVLLVGAMAISPDLLPISASAIGIVERRWVLAARALRALALGLGTAALAAFAATALMRLFHRVPDDLVLAETAMGEALTHVGPGTLVVAAAAGVAGMMAFERPGGAAVGVAISVTTIPAAAYVGAAMAMGRDDPMWGAMVVLLANVVTIVVASSLTLMLQRRSRRRRSAALAAASVEPHA
jgi:uncharacterized hydrophobic protein (TIGR00271 family)